MLDKPKKSRKATSLAEKVEKVLGEKPAATPKVERIFISPPNFQTAKVTIVGTAPYVQNKFTRRALEAMRKAQEEGSRAKNRRMRTPKDFAALYEESFHRSTEGWFGVPATALRSAMIDACRLVGYPMTKAKMTIFILPDGFDEDDEQPLIRIHGGDPRPLEMPVRQADGSTNIAVRPAWRTWKLTFTIRWDADQFAAQDVLNLLSRAGVQCGIGAGRPYSKNSNGLGFGVWEVQA